MAPALAARRTIDVLRYLSRHPHERLTLSELAARMNLAPAVMHGLLDALSEAGFVTRTDDGKRYELGPEAVLLGSAALSQDRDLAMAVRMAERLAARHDVSSFVSARRGERIVILERFGDLADHIAPIGSDYPLAAPHGACFLTDAGPHGVLAWLERGGVDPVSVEADDHRSIVDEYKATGWARVSLNGAADLVTIPVGWSDRGPAVAVTCLVDEAGPSASEVAEDMVRLRDGTVTALAV